MWAVRSDEQVFDPSPHCKKARSSLQAGFRKLLSKDPECKSEYLRLTFKKKELVRKQLRMMRTKATLKTVEKLCNDWRALTLKNFASLLSGIEGCQGGCAGHRCCTCSAGGEMKFRTAVQAFSLDKQFEASSPQQAIADCQSWLTKIQEFNPSGYVKGRCGGAGFKTYAKGGGEIHGVRGVSYQFSPHGE